MVRRAIFFLGLTLTAILPVSVLAYVSPGAPTGFVNDFAGVLTAEQKSSLEQYLQAYEASTTNEISIAVISSLDGDTVEGYSIKLAEEWQIGKEEADNGVLILVAIDDRTIRIEVGYGLEPYLTDLETQAIQVDIMHPAFRGGDYYGGLNGAVQAIEKILNGEQLDIPAASSKKSVDYSGLVNLVVFGFFIFFELIISIFARSKSWWGGGVAGGAIALLVYFVGSMAAAITAAVILIPLGLLIDYLVSKSYHKALASGRPWVFFSGRGGGGGSSFGGFGGGSFGGGGSSSRW